LRFGYLLWSGTRFSEVNRRGEASRNLGAGKKIKDSPEPPKPSLKPSRLEGHVVMS